MSRPIASLSLDLDNAWSYMKTRGDADWVTFPSYLDVVVPRFLGLLERLGLKITIFIVGQDAALPQSHAVLRSIADAGHEIGNHSFHHEPWLGKYDDAQVDDEIGRAHAAIAEATGKEPRGFRGPGYSLSRATLETLSRRGYAYDCSTFPTYIGPLARAYYFMSARLSNQEREQRDELFGTLADGLRPLRPYIWNLDGRSLVEIPVTTFPVLKVPIHFSYVLYLATRSVPAAVAYFRTAMLACRAAGIGPSLLLHPLDLLDATDAPQLAFFPAMNLARERKAEVLERALRAFMASFDVGPVGAHAQRVAASPSVRTRPWRAAAAAI
jgi:peptidoglycan/xylan/chitin deacetylase (PgdA/CDA1 family)